MQKKYEAVVFDLLTALLDSWTLWSEVAGDREVGLRWRLRYLGLTYAAGRYRPYDNLVEQAAKEVELPGELAKALRTRWDDLKAWPEASRVLRALEGRFKLGVVTNTSEALAQRAVKKVEARFDAVLSAERAGWYKPAGVPYEMMLQELGVEPGRTLYVAGSPLDIVGASAAGMDVVWHDRIGLARVYPATAALGAHPALWPVLEITGIAT
jgi:2-haloalkanoic acid dehalogenase type II